MQINSRTEIQSEELNYCSFEPRLTLQSLESRLMTLHSLISRVNPLKKSVLMQEQELISSI